MLVCFVLLNPSVPPAHEEAVHKLARCSMHDPTSTQHGLMDIKPTPPCLRILPVANGKRILAQSLGGFLSSCSIKLLEPHGLHKLLVVSIAAWMGTQAIPCQAELPDYCYSRIPHNHPYD
jgi:hypothetical protein